MSARAALLRAVAYAFETRGRCGFGYGTSADRAEAGRAASYVVDLVRPALAEPRRFTSKLSTRKRGAR